LSCGLLTGGAQTPENDLGFINKKAVVGRRFKARGCPNRTVDVHRRVAAPADKVVVVVADSSFIQRRATCRLDSADNPGRDEGIEVIVPRLTGERTDPFASCLHDRLGILMHPIEFDGLQHGEALRGNSQICQFEQFLDFLSHIINLPPYLD